MKNSFLIVVLFVFLSLTIVSCQKTAVGEATRIPTAEDVSVVQFREQLTSSEAREFQKKESVLNKGRVLSAARESQSWRGEERDEQGEEKVKPFAINFISIPPILNMKGIDYQPGAWEKITGSGAGVYTGVSAYTNPQTKQVEEILTIASGLTFASGQLWNWDSGTTQWKQVTINGISNGMIEAQIDPFNKNHWIVVLTGDAKKLTVYSTLDAGKNWNSVLSLPLSLKYDDRVTIHFFDASHLILMHDHSGIFVSSDSGKTWKNTKKGVLDKHARETQAFNSKGNALVYFLGEKKIYRSNDFGATWILAWDAAAVVNNKKEFSYAIDATGTRMYIIASQSDTNPKTVYQKDGEGAWNSFGVSFPSSRNIQSFIVDPNDNNHLIIFQYMEGPSESFDGGKSWGRDYLISGLKTDLVPEINCVGCGLPSDIRETFSDNYNHILYASDQGLFLFLPRASNSDIPTVQNVAKALSFEDAGDIKVDGCGNLYYGVWHRSPVVKTKEGYYYAEGPEKQGFILTDPSQCATAPAFVLGAGDDPDIRNYVQNSQSYELSFSFKDFRGTAGSVVYFKNKLYVLDEKNKLQRLDLFAPSYSPELVLEDINYIFKSVGDTVLYAVDSSGVVWKSNDGESWGYDVFPVLVSALFNMTSATANGLSYVLLSDFSFVGSITEGKVQAWPNKDRLQSILADKSCETRLYGVADSESKSGVDTHTVKVSSDFGLTWQEFGEGIAGFSQLYLGDTDSQYLYVATNGKGVWKRSTTGLICKKWSEVESKFSKISEICGNGFDDDGNGLADCMDPFCLNSITYNYFEETMCLNKMPQLCSPKEYGTIINLNDNFDALCSPDSISSSWVECNADGSSAEKQSTKGAPPLNGGISKSDAHYLCAPFTSTAGKEQKGYHGFESWYGCGVEKKGKSGIMSKAGDVVNNFVCTTQGWVNPALLKQFCDVVEKPNTKVGSIKEDSICAQRADLVSVIIKDNLVQSEACVGVYRGIPLLGLAESSGQKILFGMVKEGGSLISSIGWEDKLCGVYVNSVKKKGWGISDGFAYPLTFAEAKKCIDQIDLNGKKLMTKLYLDGCS